LVDDLAELVAAVPSAAVVEAFARIERELARIAIEGSLDIGRQSVSARQLADLLQEHDLIRAESATAIEGLSVMRNLAAHGRAQDDLDQARALEYLYLADAVLYALRAAPPP
jgi:hypothetical protein